MTSRPLDGDVGSWSSFGLRIGKPEQIVRVIPSTASISTWAVSPQGCESESHFAPSLCSDSRGGLFDETQSTTWRALNNGTLGIDANLGYGSFDASYGLETIHLGLGDSIGGPQLESQIVASLAPLYYYVGMFGLNYQATNFTNFSSPHPSALATIRKKGLIPSLSWAYTAGAPYRSKGFFGSLIFGGYDASRFDPNPLTLTLAPDITRDLVVGLQSLHFSSSNQTASLLPSPILTFLDSTQPFIYLPLESCHAFEDSFGLVWNASAKVYYLDNDQHQSLLAMNPNITFKIGNAKLGGATIDIVLPYASFDLLATKSAVEEPTRFFPLRRAANDTQYTLGRTFMQEAYLIVNYDRGDFSVSQARFEEGLDPEIVSITTPTHIQISRDVVIGTSIGSALVFIAFILTIICVVRCKRRKMKRKYVKDDLSVTSTLPDNEKANTICSMREMGTTNAAGVMRELEDNGKVELQDEQSPSGSGKKITEMQQSDPVIAHELMTHREQEMTEVKNLTNRIISGRIFKTTQISIKSRHSDGTNERKPYVRTMISASSQESTIRSSYSSSILESYLKRSCVYKPPNLNRSLPPTPISETPQTSPSTLRLTGGAALWLRLQDVQTRASRSRSVNLRPKNIHSRYLGWQYRNKPLPKVPG